MTGTARHGESAEASAAKVDDPGERYVIGKLDVSGAYQAVRRRREALRRRRIISSIMAAVVLAGMFSVVGYYYVESVPLPDAVSLPETTTVYYSDGVTVLARLGEQVRIPVDVSTLPSYIGDAVVAAEDPSFWDDSGARLSRQYARAAMDLDVSTVAGKARSLVMAWKLEDAYSKDQILGFYLNTVYFGRGAYGVEAAANVYFGKRAADITLAEAIVLAGMVRAPGDGAYDPSVSPSRAATRFATIASAMVKLGSLDQDSAAALTVAPVVGYRPTALRAGLEGPAGLVIAHVLAELRASPTFARKPPGYVENGGFSIITTLDVRAQRVLEQTVDRGTAGSVMSDQPKNLQAAAVVVQPGTGRVLAYYGGPDALGADYAGWYRDEHGQAVGYGAHPPGHTVDVYALAAALRAGISVKSRWQAQSERAFPASGRGPGNPVRDHVTAACQPTCTLAQAATASLNVPFYALVERIGPAAVVAAARDLGVESMWIPESADAARERVSLTDRPISTLSPEPFTTDIALGKYSVTVLDQAAAMATIAAGGKRAGTHFVHAVDRGQRRIWTQAGLDLAEPVLSQPHAADLTWVMSQDPAGALDGGRASAVKTGTVPLRTSALETAHAWTVGFTPQLAMAVWIGNVDIELPLKTREGARVTGTGLPAQIYRSVLNSTSRQMALPVRGFDAPAFGGDPAAGDARPT